MRTVKIVTDSNSGITLKEAKEIGVEIVPMPFYIDGKEFFEEISLSHEQFYELQGKDVSISTTQPSPFALQELWNNVLQECDELVFIPMSSGLSGSAETAKKLAAEYEGRVFVADNKRISVTQKESVYEAVEMTKRGKSGAEIKEYLESTGPVSSIYIALDTLKYIKKGGRAGATVKAIGTLLKIKPILYTRGGKFDTFSTALSMRQAKRKMLSQVADELETEFREFYDSGRMTVSVAHTQNFAEAEKFRQEITEKFPKLVFRFVDPLSLSIACHIGAGSLAIALSVDNFLS